MISVNRNKNCKLINSFQKTDHKLMKKFRNNEYQLLPIEPSIDELSKTLKVNLDDTNNSLNQEDVINELKLLSTSVTSSILQIQHNKSKNQVLRGNHRQSILLQDKSINSLDANQSLFKSNKIISHSTEPQKILPIKKQAKTFKIIPYFTDALQRKTVFTKLIPMTPPKKIQPSRRETVFFDKETKLDIQHEFSRMQKNLKYFHNEQCKKVHITEYLFNENPYFITQDMKYQQKNLIDKINPQMSIAMNNSVQQLEDRNEILQFLK